jgi:predicted ferric reductase
MMGLLFRGVVYFGLYLVLVLLPLGMALLSDAVPTGRSAAVEFAAAAGLIAFTIMVWEFALISRLRAASEAFGTDTLMQFHRQVGLVALLFVVLHPLALGGSGAVLSGLNPFAGGGAAQSGAIAFWSVLLLVASSVWRRRLGLRYENWQRIHSLAAVTIVTAALMHALQTGGYASSGWLRAVMILYAFACVVLLLRHRVLRPLLLRRRAWLVEENRDEGGDTRTLRLRPIDKASLEFQPGQFVWLLTGKDPVTAQQHPITISSSAESPPDRSIELSIKALGDWSRSTVPALGVGERVWIDGAYGALTPDRFPGQGFVLIAGGIGITPMRSMLHTMRDRGDVRPVLLIYAANSPARMVFRQELEALQGVLNLKVVLVFESAPHGWGGEQGLVTEAMLRRHLPVHYRHYQFFVCGPAAMMDAMEEVLVALEVPPARIGTERFDIG